MAHSQKCVCFSPHLRHAETMSACLTPTGCCSSTPSFTVLTEMLLGSASVALDQDRPRLRRPILSPTGRDLGGLTAKINQRQFQRRQCRDCRTMLQGFPFRKHTKNRIEVLQTCVPVVFGRIFGFSFNLGGKEGVATECSCF